MGGGFLLELYTRRFGVYDYYCDSTIGEYYMVAAMAFQVTPLEPFAFTRLEEWPKWIRQFEQFQWGMTWMTSFTHFAFQRRIQRSTKRCLKPTSWKEETLFSNGQSQPEKTEGVGESADAFIMNLYSLAEHCDYRDLWEELIRGRIVVGILERVLSEKLQMDATLTLKKAVSMMQQSEC